MGTIELNGRTYQEADHGHFEAALIDSGEMIAYTDGDHVVMLSGNRQDVELWADSYDLPVEEV